MVPVCMQNRQFALKTTQASLHESLCNGLGRILFHSHLFSCSIPFFFNTGLCGADDEGTNRTKLQKIFPDLFICCISV